MTRIITLLVVLSLGCSVDTLAQYFKGIGLSTAKINKYIDKAKAKNNVAREVFFNTQIGRLQLEEMKFQSAEATLLHSTNLILQENGPKKWTMGAHVYSIVDCFDILAGYYQQVGNFDEALRFLHISDSIRTRHHGPKSKFRIVPKLGLASVYLSMADYEMAGKYYEDLLHLLNKAKPNNLIFNEYYRACYFGLSKVELKKKNQLLAERYLAKALKHDRNNVDISLSDKKISTKGIQKIITKFIVPTGGFSKKKPDVEPITLNLAAQVLLADSKTELAEQVNAIALLTRTNSLAYYREMLRTRIDIELKVQNVSSIFSAVNELLENYQKDVTDNFHFLSEREKELFMINMSNDFDLAASIAKIYSDNPLASTIHESLYNFHINTKGLIQNELRVQHQLISQLDNDSIKSIYDELILNKRILSNFAYNKKANPIDKQKIEEKIESLDRKFSKAIGSKVTTRKAVTWDSLRNTLQPDESILEIKRFRFSNPRDPAIGLNDSIMYMAFSVTSNSQKPEVRILESGNKMEKKMVDYYRNMVKFGLSTGPVHEIFWRPVIPQSKRVYFSPDGSYNLININTLLNEKTSRYVVDEYEIVQMTSSRDLIEEKIFNTSNRAFLAGAPLFNLKGSGDRSIETFDQIVEQEFADLPGAKIELNKVGQMLNSKTWEVTSFTGADATEDKVKQINSVKLIHLATHGFFLGDIGTEKNPMLASGLILGKPTGETNGNTDDGILTAEEVATLNLQNTDIVVLSACETGLGEVKNGEGVYGLQRAFNIAGAKYVIMSLWKVDDDATQLLMTEFYKNWLSTDDVFGSFTAAQKSLRATYNAKYWGAFVLLGTPNKSERMVHAPLVDETKMNDQAPIEKRALVVELKSGKNKKYFKGGDQVQVTYVSEAGKIKQYNGGLGKISDKEVVLGKESIALGKLLGINKWTPGSDKLMAYTLMGSGFMSSLKALPLVISGPILVTGIVYKASKVKGQRTVIDSKISVE